MANASSLSGRLPATSGGTDYQAYYDDNADLTWLADANAAVNSTYDTYTPGSGLMTWFNATDWVASLDVAGVTGWRLPVTVQPDASCSVQNSTFGDYGQGCIGGELGNIFYNVLGDTAGSLSNVGPFSNIQSGSPYWSTESVSIPSYAWYFSMDNGSQDATGKYAKYSGWAVQSGDVSAVPVPAAVWLFGSGLLGLMGVARRK
ncbi:MAG: DUF1566 domain-containing protein [Gammaproteobacteria bacterium]|nr:DUF1566 domain-containing protein [Gammaproteobacteria bacterium]